MKYEYRVRTDVVFDEDENPHTVYGVDLFVNGEVKRSVPDVFFEKGRADEFVGACNTLHLRPMHLDDAVEDAITL